MYETNPESPKPSLYGAEESVSQPTSVSLGDVLVGVFTEPGALFDRLRQSPKWGGAFGITLSVAVLLTVIWSLKVDVDALLRPILEADRRIPADSIDNIIAMQGKMMVVFGPIQALLGVSLVSLLAGSVLWLVGKGFSETGQPSFKQAFTGAVVPGLVTLPQSFCILLMCFLKEVGGRTPEKMAPTGVGFFMTVDHPKLQAFLHVLDPFTFAYLALLFIAARRLLRLSLEGAALSTGILALLVLGLRVGFAR